MSCLVSCVRGAEREESLGEGVPHGFKAEHYSWDLTGWVR